MSSNTSPETKIPHLIGNNQHQIYRSYFRELWYLKIHIYKQYRLNLQYYLFFFSQKIIKQKQSQFVPLNKKQCEPTGYYIKKSSPRTTQGFSAQILKGIARACFSNHSWPLFSWKHVSLALFPVGKIQVTSFLIKIGVLKEMQLPSTSWRETWQQAYKTWGKNTTLFRSFSNCVLSSTVTGSLQTIASQYLHLNDA